MMNRTLREPDLEWDPAACAPEAMEAATAFAPHVTVDECFIAADIREAMRHINKEDSELWTMGLIYHTGRAAGKREERRRKAPPIGVRAEIDWILDRASARELGIVQAFLHPLADHIGRRTED